VCVKVVGEAFWSLHWKQWRSFLSEGFRGWRWQLQCLPKRWIVLNIRCGSTPKAEVPQWRSFSTINVVTCSHCTFNNKVLFELCLCLVYLYELISRQYAPSGPVCITAFLLFLAQNNATAFSFEHAITGHYVELYSTEEHYEYEIRLLLESEATF
jgi:hypothetical protein